MKTFLAIMIFLTTSLPVQAGGAISLNPWPGEAEVDIEETLNITGTCGSSLVRVMGVTRQYDDVFSVDPDAGMIIIRKDFRNQMIIDHKSRVLSDHNGLACVESRLGSFLLLWSTCGGSGCPDAYSFFVIDTDRLYMIAPRDLSSDYCDEHCAAEIIGDDLPIKLNHEKR